MAQHVRTRRRCAGSGAQEEAEHEQETAEEGRAHGLHYQPQQQRTPQPRNPVSAATVSGWGRKPPRSAREAGGEDGEDGKTHNNVATGCSLDVSSGNARAVAVPSPAERRWLDGVREGENEHAEDEETAADCSGGRYPPLWSSSTERLVLPSRWSLSSAVAPAVVPSFSAAFVQEGVAPTREAWRGWGENIEPGRCVAQKQVSPSYLSKC